MWLVIVLLISYYVYMRLSCGVTRSSVCLLGKTAIITGANSGIGYQTALNLASRGCKVIMADVADMDKSKKNIIKYTNNSNIYTEYLDLKSLKSVRQFGCKILESEERLDILINNAGIGFHSYRNTTEDGLDPLMQINYFGHFLLTHLLIDLLKKSVPSRIVWTSSCMAFINNLTIQNLNDNNYKDGFTSFQKFFRYSNSKFVSLVASDIFAEKLRGTGVTSSCIHPGGVRTPFYNDTSTINIVQGFLIRLFLFIFGKDSWEGSQTLVHVAVSKKLEKVTGKYFWDCKPFIKPPKAYNRELCQGIWKASEKYVGLKPEEQLK